MTVLATLSPAFLAAQFGSTTFTVEQTIKSVARIGTTPADALGTLRDLWNHGKANDLGEQFRIVIETAAALITEREAAHEEALRATGTEPCDGCSGDGVYRFPGGCFENGVWRGKVGQCFRCGGTGRQTIKDTRRNRFYDNHVRRVYA